MEYHILISLLNELGPVLEGASHHSGMDKVEFVIESPCFLDIVYLKADVGWDERWLGWAHVDTDDLATCQWAASICYLSSYF